ncbi:MAG: 8-amino-7-oxononanoate synthase, partial [Myxococcaceae bacterium]|nr:8-amino-7-oxononanoate synthase [Myxococcaceae bacterium]
SRHISGNMAAHRKAERALAAYVHQAQSALFSTGYACNVGVVQSLVDGDDIVFSDRLNHASLIDGARLSRGKVVIYEHADATDLERKLRQHRGEGSGALVLTESLFSMDGDVPPLRDIAKLAREFDAGLLVDEAHALGVMGPDGRGLCAELDVRPDVIIGTLGKAFGAQGAFAAANEQTIELVRNRARSYIFSTAPAPALAAIATAALRLVRDANGLRDQLRARSLRLRAGLRELDYRVPEGVGPIIPIMIGESGPTMELSRALFDRGVFVHGVRPPTVPAGTGRLRVVPMATHTDEDISQALRAFAEVRR